MTTEQTTVTTSQSVATPEVMRNSRNPLFSDLQTALQKRYDISQPYSVDKFISHDAETLGTLTGITPDTPEMLLVHQENDNLDITLFLDKAVTTSLPEKSWSEHWNGKHFDNYCIVLEGISHFVYLSWSAHHDRSVRLLELELQAEIDKFVFASLDANAQDTRRLITRLFDDVSYRASLSKESRIRYEKANQLAQHYCLWLRDNFDLSRQNRQLTAELARFYRISGSAKFRHITDRLH